MISYKSKRQIILDHAAVLFKDMGYSASSMKDIAQRVGVKPASLYNHIDSKQQILVLLLLDIAYQFKRGIDDVNNSEYTPKEKLREIIRMHIRISTENQDITAILLNDWKHLESPHLEEFKAIREEYQDIFSDVIQASMEKGQIKKMDVKTTLNIILSSLRWIYDSELYNMEQDVSITELERTILQVVFSGLDVAGS